MRQRVLISALGTWLRRRVEALWWRSPDSLGLVYRFLAKCLGALYHRLSMLHTYLRQRAKVSCLQACLQHRIFIIVGNISVGGNGKTPIVIQIAHWLRDQGYRPACISRGYGSPCSHARLVVLTSADAADQYGDEALLLAKAGFPVAVGTDRYAALSVLLTSYPQCDVVLSDDGLQYFPVSCGIRLCIWGQRGAGNAQLLPCGPLREPLSDMGQAHAVIQDLDCPIFFPVSTPYFRYQRHLSMPISICSGERVSWSELGPVVDAVASISAPAYFFDAVRSQGIEVDGRDFPDHHAYQQYELEHYQIRPLLMTEKDSVKCRVFARKNWYCVPLECRIEEPFWVWLKERIEHYGQDT